MAMIDDMLSDIRNEDNDTTEEGQLLLKQLDDSSHLNLMKKTGLASKDIDAPLPEENPIPSVNAYVEGNRFLNAISTAQDIIDAPKDIITGMMDSTSDDTWENLKYHYNKELAEPIRDKLGFDSQADNEGAWYQPSLITDPETGEVMMTGNKSTRLDGMSAEDKKYVLGEMSKRKNRTLFGEIFESPDEHFLYQRDNEEKDLTKIGLSRQPEGVWDRYAEDRNLGWKNTKNLKTGGATDMERLHHGTNQDKRVSQYEKNSYDPYVPLDSGRTETYFKSEFFGENATGTSPTRVQARATATFDELLTPKQKKMQDGMRNKVMGAEVKRLSEQNMHSEEWKSLSPKKYAQVLAKKNEATQFSPKGAISEEELFKSNQYSKVANKVYNTWFRDEKPDTEAEKLFRKAITENDALTGEERKAYSKDMYEQARRLGVDIGKLRRNKANPELTQYEKNEKVARYMSSADWNLAVKGGLAFVDKSPEFAQAYALARDMYRTTSTTINQIGSGTAGVFTDPTNIAGIGMFTKLAKTLGATKIAALEGAGYGALDADLDQRIGIEGKQQEKYSIMHTLIGAGAGMVLGGSLGHVISSNSKGELPGIDIDKIDAERTRVNTQLRNATNKEDRKMFGRKRAALKTYQNEHKNIMRIKDENDRAIKLKQLELKTMGDWANKGYLEQDNTNRKKTDQSKFDTPQSHLGKTTYKDSDGNTRIDVGLNKEGIKANSISDKVDAVQSQKPHQEKIDEKNVEITEAQKRRKKEIKDDGTSKMVPETEKIDPTNPREGTFQLHSNREPRVDRTQEPTTHEREIDAETATFVNQNGEKIEGFVSKISKDGKTKTYQFADNGEITKVTVDENGNVKRVIADKPKPFKLESEKITPNREMKPTNLLPKDRKFVENWNADRKAGKRIHQGSAKKYERLLEESQSPRPEKNTFIKDEDRLAQHGNDEDLAREAGIKERKHGKDGTYGQQQKRKADESDESIAEMDRQYIEESYSLGEKKPLTNKGEVFPDPEYKDIKNYEELVMEELGDSERAYTINWYNSHQKGQSGVAIVDLKEGIKDFTNIKEIRDRIKDLTDSFNNTQKNRALTGKEEVSTSAKAKGENKTDAEWFAERLDYQKNAIWSFIKNSDVDDKTRKQLYRDLNAVEATRAKVRNKGVKTDEMQAKIDAEYDAQFRINYEYDNKIRHDKITKDFKFAELDARYQTKHTSSPYGKMSAKDKNVFVKRLFENLVREKNRLANKVAKAEAKIRNQNKIAGKIEDASSLEAIPGFREEKELIQRYRNLSDDLIDLTSGKITNEEFIFRQTQWAEDNVGRTIDKMSEKDIPAEQISRALAEDFAQLGIDTHNKITEPVTKGGGQTNALREDGNGGYTYGKYNIRRNEDGSFTASNAKGDFTRASVKTLKEAEQVIKNGIEFNKNRPREEKPLTAEQLKEIEEFNSKQKGQRNAQVKKFNNYKSGDVEARRKNQDYGHGKEQVTENQKDFLERGATPAELANIENPIGATKENLADMKDDARTNLEEVLNNRNRSKMGIVPEVRFRSKEQLIDFQQAVIDSSNSMLQIMSVLMGSKDFAGYSKLTGTNVDVRNVIGEEMMNYYDISKILDKDGKPKDPKDVVKYFFMTENYGQGEKGLINLAMKDHGLNREMAEKFVKAYYKSADKVLPQIKQFRDMINDRMKRPELGKDISWTLPNGDKISMSVHTDSEGVLRVQGKDNELIVKTDDLDTASSALMPSYIQSYDAYIVKEMKLRGHEYTTHDSFVLAPGKTEKQMQDDMGDILSNILEGNYLEKNVKEMNPDYPHKIEMGNLRREDIMTSYSKMDIEHGPKKGPEEVELKKRENNGLKSDIELMKEFMGSSNFRNIPIHSLINSIMENVYKDNKFSKMFESDDPFDRQVALAMRDSVYDVDKAILAPKDIDPKMWDKAQREIFAEARAKAERYPGLAKRVDGERIFFGEDMKDIHDPIKTKAEIENRLRAEDYEDRRAHNKAINEEYAEVRARNERIIQEIKDLETAKAKYVYSNFTTKEKQAMLRIGKDYESVANTVFGWHSKRTLDEYEAFAKATIQDIQTPTHGPQWYNSLKDGKANSQWGAFFQRQVNFSNPSMKQLRVYQNLNKKYSENVAKYTEELVKRWSKDIPRSERKHWVNSLLKTDYIAIRGMTQKQANDFVKTYDDVYQKAQPYIDRAAKGLGQAEKQFGFYYNNPGQIAAHLGMPKETIEIIDKLISIKAMDDDAWKFIDSKKNDSTFDEILNVIYHDQKESKEILFKDNPESYIKGYVKDKYNNNLKIREDGQGVEFVTERDIRGATPVEKENQTRGRSLKEGADIPEHFQNTKKKPTQTKHKDLADVVLGELENMGTIKGKTLGEVADNIMKSNHIVRTYRDVIIKMLSEELSRPVNKKYGLAEHKIAENLNLKVSGKETRRIAQKEIREQLGRSDDFVDMLSETVGSNRIKLGRRAHVKSIKKMATDDLFSKNEKIGFVKVSDEKLAGMAGDLANNFKYVRKEFRDMLLGREEATITNMLGIDNHRARVVDRLLRDSMMRFKKNNVIMNLPSHVNAFIYNQTIGMSEGATPWALAKYQKEATTQLSEFNKIWESIARRKSQGKPFDKLLRKLEKNELYQMQKDGMAINVVDGVDLSTDLIREILGSSILGKSKIMNVIFKNIGAEADSYIGNKLAKSFSWIDTSGRYAMVKHYMSDAGGNMSRIDAVNMANGLFGDMGQIAPKLIEALDNYAVPFAKWFASVLPGTIKGFKNNPTKYLTVMVGLYLMGVESDPDGKRPWYSIRTDGWGPLVSMADFAGDSWGQVEDLTNDLGRTNAGEAMFRRFTKRFAPGYITRPGWKMRQNSENKRKDTMDDVLINAFKSYASKDYEKVKGKPLETIGIGKEALHSLFGNKQFSYKTQEK